MWAVWTECSKLFWMRLGAEVELTTSTNTPQILLQPYLQTLFSEIDVMQHMLDESSCSAWARVCDWYVFFYLTNNKSCFSALCYETANKEIKERETMTTKQEIYHLVKRWNFRPFSWTSEVMLLSADVSGDCSIIGEPQIKMTYQQQIVECENFVFSKSGFICRWA